MTLALDLSGIEWSLETFYTDTPGVTASASGTVTPAIIVITFPPGTFAVGDVLYADLPVIAPNAGIPSTVISAYSATVNGDGSATATVTTTAPTEFGFMLRVTAMTSGLA